MGKCTFLIVKMKADYCHLSKHVRQMETLVTTMALETTKETVKYIQTSLYVIKALEIKRYMCFYPCCVLYIHLIFML